MKIYLRDINRVLRRIGLRLSLLARAEGNYYSDVQFWLHRTNNWKGVAATLLSETDEPDESDKDIEP